MAEYKTIGILGGMGPLATVDLFDKIVRMTDAESDQEHLHIIIDNFPAIPDRTEAILRGGESSLPMMIESAQRLQRTGAELIVIPCNTAHYFYDGVCEAVSIPVLNMIEETAIALSEQNITRIGLLATDGTIKTDVYRNMMDKFGIEMILPDHDERKIITHVIYQGVKAGKEVDIVPFHDVGRRMLDDGAQTLVLACTELPPAFTQYHLDLPHVDPTLILAIAAIKAAGAKVKRPH